MMAEHVTDAPIAIAHQQQIKISHAIIITLMEEIVTGHPGPSIKNATNKRKQNTLISLS